MAHGALVADTLLTAAKDRCDALGKVARAYAKRAYPSPGPHTLIRLVHETSQAMKRALTALESNTELRELLTPEEFRLRVHTHAEFVPALHFLLSFINGAQSQDTPYMLLPALRRLLRTCFPDTEVIFASQPDLNYSHQDVAGTIKGLYEKAALPELQGLGRELPDHLLVLTFPSVETNNVLMHCILGHEIGHDIYSRSKLEEQLYRFVTIDQDEMKALVRATLADLPSRHEAKDQLSLFPNEVQVRNYITRKLTAAIRNWLEEFCCDAIGLCLFGPAYFAAFLDFIVSRDPLDSVSESHPAPRLRLRMLGQMMEEGEDGVALGYVPHFHPKLKERYTSWKAEAAGDVRVSDPIFRLAVKAITPALHHVARVAITTCKPMLYDAAKFKRTEQLSAILVNVIPPIDALESNDNGGQETEAVDLVSILNAGWIVSLCFMDEFRANLPAALQADAKERLAWVVLKAAELSETRKAWGEATVAAGR